MKIRPLYDRVVVRRKEEEQTTAGGIVLPGSAKEKPNQGEVIAVGEGKALDSGEVRPLSVKVGDTVVFGQYAGSNTIEVDGEDEAVAVANDSEFGLGAAVFTRDLERGEAVARRIEAGNVFVNMLVASDPRLPFGGIKMSGRGREGLHDTLDEMTEQKIILLHDALSVFAQE